MLYWTLMDIGIWQNKGSLVLCLNEFYIRGQGSHFDYLKGQWLEGVAITNENGKKRKRKKKTTRRKRKKEEERIKEGNKNERMYQQEKERMKLNFAKFPQVSIGKTLKESLESLCRVVCGVLSLHKERTLLFPVSEGESGCIRLSLLNIRDKWEEEGNFSFVCASGYLLMHATSRNQVIFSLKFKHSFPFLVWICNLCLGFAFIFSSNPEGMFTRLRPFDDTSTFSCGAGCRLRTGCCDYIGTWWSKRHLTTEVKKINATKVILTGRKGSWLSSGNIY